MRTSTAILRVIAAATLLVPVACNKARRYPTISARSPDGGNINVRGTYNRCPRVIFIASPDHAPVGRPISLMAIASDLDGDELTYTWTATSGTFSSTSAVTTTFECARNGAVTVTLTVSDASCPSATSGLILCQPGDGGVTDGGVPDGGADAGRAGAGGASGGSGSTGAGGAAGAAGGAATGAAGSAGGGAAGQGGVVGGAGATGGRAGMGSGGTGLGATCVETEPPAALATACSTCIDTNANPDTDGCCEITDPVGLNLCRAASACMRGGGSTGVTCNVGGEVTSCFCGSDQVMGCDQPGAARGPCVAEFTAAAGRDIVKRMTDSPTAAQVLARQVDPNFALGRASNVHGTAALFCPAECGF